jgi:UDP:flavonoid glycosyltransferase YjiC (YdhE family)
VTFGTIFTNPELLTPLIRKLTAKGHGVRVALGVTASPADFAIDGIYLVVGHGGAGTNLGALAAGIPLVLIPQGADQGGQAECVARTGAAITIAAEAFSPRAVALAVADVLEQPSYRATARRIAHRIATMPSADDVAALLARAAHPDSP